MYSFTQWDCKKNATLLTIHNFIIYAFHDLSDVKKRGPLTL